MRENWKQVVGYEDSYLVSDKGNVFSLKSNKLLKHHFGSCGYKNVFLYNGHNHKNTKKIHRLVLEAFIINPENKSQVNHKDGNKHNNNLFNLEWATNSENAKHAVKTGLRQKPKGEKNPFVKISDLQIEDIRKLLNSKEYKQIEIARMFKISPQVISRIKLGERKKTYETQ